MPESSQCPARLQPYWVSPWTVSGRPAAGLHGDHGEPMEIVLLGHSGDWVFRWPGLASPDCGCGTVTGLHKFCMTMALVAGYREASTTNEEVP